jgi:hypothetical protein
MSLRNVIGSRLRPKRRSHQQWRRAGLTWWTSRPDLIGFPSVSCMRREFSPRLLWRAVRGLQWVQAVRTAWVSRRTPNHVRDEGSFPPKRSPGAGDGCAAGHSQPRLLLMAELAQIADARAGDPGICNGPTRDSCTAKDKHRGDPIIRSRGVQRAANLRLQRPFGRAS